MYLKFMTSDLANNTGGGGGSISAESFSLTDLEVRPKHFGLSLTLKVQCDKVMGPLQTNHRTPEQL